MKVSKYEGQILLISVKFL